MSSKATFRIGFRSEEEKALFLVNVRAIQAARGLEWPSDAIRVAMKQLASQVRDDQRREELQRIQDAKGTLPHCAKVGE